MSRCHSALVALMLLPGLASSAPVDALAAGPVAHPRLHERAPIYVTPLTKHNVTHSMGPGEPAWVKGPQGRGTLNLIIGCLTTLSLCVWTALHLNVHPSRSITRAVWRKARWMMMAVFWPEVVLNCAWRQYSDMRDLRKKINAWGATGQIEISEDERCDCIDRFTRILPKRLPKPENFTPWTRQQAYFAVMGGYAVKVEGLTKSHMTLTPAGVYELAKADLLPKCSDDDVGARSMADLMAKLLVCVQAGWFLAQCVARLADGLPITLLEVHVLTHIGCAWLMYCIWFAKPYAVESPIFLDNPDAVDLAALFALHSTTWRTLKTESFSSSASRRCCQASILQIEQVERAEYGPEDTSSQNSLCNAANRAVARLRIRGSHLTWRECGDGSLEFPKNLVVWKQNNFSTLGKTTSSIGKSDDKIIRDEYPSMARLGRETMAWGLVSLVYGIAHLGAWQSHFPTYLEMWMWRASGMIIVATPVSMLLFFALAFSSDGMVKDEKDAHIHERKAVRTCGLFCSIIPGIILNILGNLYIFARLFLTIEACICLRSTPLGTYKTVWWSNFIPHFN